MHDTKCTMPRHTPPREASSRGGKRTAMRLGRIGRVRKPRAAALARWGRPRPVVPLESDAVVPIKVALAALKWSIWRIDAAEADYWQTQVANLERWLAEHPPSSPDR